MGQLVLAIHAAVGMNALKSDRSTLLGLVRFASIKYERGKTKQRRMHLTNVKLNKGHARDGSQEDLFEDGKWSLAQLWQYIQRENLGEPGTASNFKEYTVERKSLAAYVNYTLLSCVCMLPR
jgi:Tubulin-tyrosine ligase family